MVVLCVEPNWPGPSEIPDFECGHNRNIRVRLSTASSRDIAIIESTMGLHAAISSRYRIYFVFSFEISTNFLLAGVSSVIK